MDHLKLWFYVHGRGTGKGKASEASILDIFYLIDKE